MSRAPQVNCETFQVRAGVQRLSVERGLAVSDHDGRQYLDPQVEPHYWTSLGPAPRDRLNLEFSKSDPPEMHESLVKQFSISRNALLNHERIRRYRIFKKAEKAVGRVAIVSVVNHQGVHSLIQRIKSSNGSTELQAYHYHYPWSDEVSRLYDPFIHLLAVPEEGTIVIPHDVGGDFNSDLHDFRFTYLPDTEEGLVINRRDTPSGQPPPNQSGGDGAGDREPRNPKPAAPTDAIGLDVR